MITDTLNKTLSLSEKIIQENNTLLRLLHGMGPELQEEYAPKVEKMINKSDELIRKESEQ